MILDSPRITAADRAMWNTLESADRVHARRIVSRVAEAIDCLRLAVTAGACYVSVSGGKDSAVLVGLLDECGLLAEVPAVWLRAVPKHHPETPRVLDALASRFPSMRCETVDYVSPVPLHVTPDQAEQVATANFLRAARAVRLRLGTPILGLRRDESRARRLRFASYGLVCQASICPLGRWSLADVFAYAASRDVPLAPVYAMLGAGRWPRDQLRIDALMGERGNAHGRAEWEREYYGDVLRRLEYAAAKQREGQVDG